ncbi:asparagine synthase (glutamine-hydrolyzing) [Acidobacteria bacterium AH-259-D05]|nr:asparagine synthase (glutamine-hydrolyzing) [Acidobacteria bacterium AH-259-D05]
MCGINGIFGEENLPLVKRMNDSLSHRGPDDRGLYGCSGVTLGMSRLAIIDLQTGHQPISNETADHWIVFNGEIYNYLALREDLEKHGHRFSSHTDTEVILHLFEEKGTETPKLLRGDFAFAIWNEVKRRGFLARDHLGVKPLYYAPVGGKVIFSSELKAILRDERLSPQLDPDALDLYLTFLYIPYPWTIYKNIYKLPPGSYLEYECGEYQIVKYWEPPTDLQSGQHQKEIEERIYSRLHDSVSVRLMSDVPLGVFLSGGLDSTAIVALMSHTSAKPVKTFSVGYGEKFSSFNELEFGRLVSDYYETEHHELVVEPDIRETIVQVVQALDEPFGDSSAIPTYLVSQQTAGAVKVALSGIGGDELFGGYPRYLGQLWETRYRALPLALRKLFSRISSAIPERESSRNIGGWARNFLAHPEDSSPDRYRRWMSFNSTEERRALYSKDFLKHLTSLDGDKAYFRQLFEPVGNWDTGDQVFYVDLASYLVNDLLFMADQMGMAHSLEIRVPFCDHLLLEDLIRHPWQRKIGSFTLKKLLKKILKRDLPPQILSRKKQGFMIPVGTWMKNELRSMFEDCFATKKLGRQAIFDPVQVNHLFQAHISGKVRKTNQLWGLFVFQLWYERMEQKISW